MTNKEILFGIIGTMVVFGLIYFSAWKDNQWQKKVNAEGGYVGVVNRSDHRVALQLFGHDETGVTLLKQTLEPGEVWIIRDSMSKAEVSAFPPKGFVDSALLIFDDTLPVWHKGEYPWDGLPRKRNRIYWCGERFRRPLTARIISPCTRTAQLRLLPSSILYIRTRPSLSCMICLCLTV